MTEEEEYVLQKAMDSGGKPPETVEGMIDNVGRAYWKTRKVKVRRTVAHKIAEMWKELRESEDDTDRRTRFRKCERRFRKYVEQCEGEEADT